jgi:PAS domain S-box-containing protein
MVLLRHLSQKPEQPSAILRYGLAALGVLFVIGATEGVGPAVLRGSPLLLLVLWTMWSSFYGGRKAGLFATAISGVCALYFLIEPRHSFRIVSWSEGVRLAVFLLVCYSASLTIGFLRQAHRAALQSEARFRMLSENIPELVWTSSMDGRTQYRNSRWEEYTGLPNSEPLRSQRERLIHPEDWPALQQAWTVALETGSGFSHEFRLRRHDGVYRWFRSRAVLVRDAPGALGEWFGTNSDIQESREMQEKLEQERQRLEKILDTSPGLVCSLRLAPDGKMSFPFASSRIESLYGVSPDEAARDAAPVFARIHPADLVPVQECISESARTMTDWLGDFRVYHPQRGEIWVEGHSRPEKQEDGSILWYGVLNDITNRKQTEKALAESQAQLRLFIEHAPASIAMLDREMRYLAASRRWLTDFRLGTDDIVGRSHYDLFPEIPERWKQIHRRCLAGAVERCDEDRFERADGSVDWLRWEIHPWRNSEDEIGGIIILSEDITARKQAEEVVLKTKMRYSELFEHMLEGLALCEIVYANGQPVDFTYLAVNESFGRLTGLKDVVGKNVSEVVPGLLEADVELFQGYARVARTGVPEKFERFVNALNMWFYISVYRPERDRFVAVFDVITKRKEAELALARSEALYRAIAANVPDSGVWVFDKDLRFLVAEGPLIAALGGSREMTEGHTLHEVVPSGVAGVVEHGCREALAGRFRSREFEEAGRTFWARVVPLRDQSGEISRGMILMNDITQRQRAQEEIRKLNAELELRVQQRTAQLLSANKELEAFSYSVSHDLRAPLRGIDGWSQALLEDYGDCLDDRAQRYLDRVRSETQRMGMLIDDMLQLSRVTQTDLKLEAVDLSALLHNIASRLREEHHARDIDFQIEPGLTICADARLMKIALQNLLDNAVKFTASRPQAVVQFGRTRTNGEDVLFVRDNGVGFDMTYAANLFGAFQRLHRAEEFPGTGIGLATVQRVVHKHGGRVWADSQVDRGATFYFTQGGQGWMPR